MNRVALFLLLALCIHAQDNYVLPAFPPVGGRHGAEGAGMAVTGGRGGDVVWITRLDDTDLSGDGVGGAVGTHFEGDLRYALSRTGARTIIPRTNGWVTLQRAIFLDGAQNNFTFAGHLAPGDGIGIRAGATMSGNGMIYANSAVQNFIFRHVRFRMGDAGGGTDAVYFGGIDGPGITNALFANCSFSWGDDETFSLQYGEFVTVQDCIIAEGLADPGTLDPIIASPHNLGGLFSGRVTVVRNIFANQYSRAPHIRGEVDVINNVQYNHHHAVHSTDGSWTPKEFNVIGNYMIPGPAKPAIWPGRDPKQQISYHTAVDMHLSGNVVQGYEGFASDQLNYLIDSFGRVNNSRFTGRAWVTEMTAAQALAYATNNAGARLPARDAVDIRIVNEVRGQAAHAGSYFGWVEDEDWVGGYPTLASGTPYEDTDGDGMRDDWEVTHFGSIGARNGKLDADGDGYTDWEEFANGTDPNEYVDYFIDFFTGEPRTDTPPPPPPPVEGAGLELGTVEIGTLETR